MAQPTQIDSAVSWLGRARESSAILRRLGRSRATPSHHSAGRVDHQAFRLGLVGLPEKEFIEDPIYEHILRGEEDLVAEYCKLDCLDTLLLYLLWALHCGQLEESEMREHVKLIRRELEPEPAWTDIAERLEEWPRWPTEGLP